MTIRVAFLLPHFRPGGAERAVLNWIGALDRTRFAPLLMLGKVDGAFLDLLPPDVVPVSLGGARALRLRGAIRTALAHHRIDIAYSATNAMNLATLAAATSARRIVSEHTPPAAYLAEAKLPAFRRAAMRLLYPRADAIAVPTDRIGRELATALRRPLPLATIPNPIVGGSPPPRPAPGDILRIAAAGRLVPAKGFDTLIAAAARLDRPFHLTIHGEGPLHDPLFAQIVALGLADRITLAGHTPDLPAALAQADLFVLSSRREGFGNVLVEAMAVGTPVLATRSGGPETFIVDAANGFLTAPEDAPALAVAITRLAADAPLRTGVVASARATAQGYAIAASTRRLEALLGSLTSRSTAA